MCLFFSPFLLWPFVFLENVLFCPSTIAEPKLGPSARILETLGLSNVKTIVIWSHRFTENGFFDDDVAVVVVPAPQHHRRLREHHRCRPMGAPVPHDSSAVDGR